jgi:hypothetical protein
MLTTSGLDSACRAGEGRAARRPTLGGAGTQPFRGREGVAADPGRGGLRGRPLEERLLDRQLEGRARLLALGEASAWPTMGGVGACRRAGEGWARRLGGQPGEGQTRHFAREEASTAIGGGAAQAGRVVV